MHKRSLGSLLLGLAAAAFAAWLYWGVPAAEREIQVRAESALSAALKRPARVGRVDVHPLLLRVVFEDVRLGEPDRPVFRCDRWSLQLTPFHLRRTYPWFAFALGRSVLENPTVSPANLGPSSGAPPLAGLKDRPLWLFHNLIWTGGAVDGFPLPGGATFPSLSGVSGFLRVSPHALAVEAAGTGEAGPIDVSASALRDGTWTLNASAPDVPLESASSLAPRLPVAFSGRAALAFEASGSAGGETRWSLSGNVSDGAALFDGGAAGPLRLPAAGAFRLTPERLEFKDARLLGRLALSGRVEKPLSPARTFDLALEGRDVSLDELRRQFPAEARWRAFPADGRGDLRATLAGTPAAPRVEAALSLRAAALAGVSLLDVNATLKNESGALEASFEMLGGKLSFVRKQERGSTPLGWDLRLDQLDLAALADANEWGRIGGRVSGRFRLQADTDGGPFTLAAAAARARADGHLRVDRFAWGVHQETAPIAGRLSLRKGRLTVEGEKEVFRAEAKVARDRISLSEFTFELPSGLAVEASGDVTGPERRLDLKAALRRWPVREVPLLLARYPAVEGTLEFEGRLGGTIKEPSFEGRASLARLKLRADGDAVDARADVVWNGGGLAVERFSVGAGWEGRAAWSPDGPWSFSVKADGADARLLADLLGDPSLEGRLTGEASLASEGGAPASWKGSAGLAWDAGRWKTLAFDRAEARLALAGGRLAVESFDLRQASGTWRASGSLPLAASEKPFELANEFRRFAAGGAVLDGELKLSGFAGGAPFGARGDLKSPNFWVNDVGVGAVEGRFRWDEGRLAVDSFDAGGARGRFALNTRTRVLEGRLAVKDAPLADWAPRLGLKNPLFAAGRLDGTLAVSGPWTSPRAEFTADWKGADWRGFGADVAAAGSYENGRLVFDSIRAKFAGRGSAEGSGSVALRPAPEADGSPGLRAVDVSISVKDAPLEECARAAGLKAPAWSGSFEGKIAWGGTLDAPLVTGALEGGEVRRAAPDGEPAGDWASRALVTRWGGAVRYQDRQLHFDDVSVKTPEGLWRLKPGSSAFLTGPGQGHMRLVSELRNIHLGPLSLFGGLEIIGQWSSQPAPALECQLRAQSLWVNQQRFDQDLARLAWSGRTMTFTPVAGSLQQIAGTVRLENWPQVRLENLTFSEDGARRFWMDGEVGKEKWDFTLEGAGLSAGTLIGLADMDLPVDGRLDVHLRGTGSSKNPRVEGDVVGEAGTLGRLPYDRVSARVLWTGPRLEVINLEASRKGRYLLRGEGLIPVGADESAADDLSFSLRLTDGDLGLLEEVWADCRKADGSFRGELQFRPGREGIESYGFLIVEDGRIKADKYVRDVSDFTARLLIRDNRLVFEKFSAKVGRGRLWVQGDLGLNGFDVTDYNLAIDSVGEPGVQIEVPQLAVPPGALLKRFSLLRESLENVSRGEPLVYLRINGPDGRHVIAGTVVMHETQFTYPPAKKSFANVPKDSWVREFWDQAAWDVVFRAGENTWYRNEYVNVQIAGEMRVFGERGDMRADGRLGTERGVITYLGQTYRLKEGVFEVVTDTRTSVADRTVVPYLTAVAERTAIIPDARNIPTPDTVTMIVKRRPLGEIQPEFVSRNNPGLSSDQVAKRTFGLRDDQYTPFEKEQLLRAGLVQLLGSTAGPLASRIAHRFGIDILYPIYEPPEDQLLNANQPAFAQRRDTTSLLQGTGASAGVQLTNRVFGMYKFKVEETSNQLYFRDELELIYRLRGNLHLRASTELDSEKLLGQPPNRQAVLENQWRFGQPKPESGGPQAQPATPEPAAR